MLRAALFTIPVRAVSVANVREHWSKRAKRAKLHRETAAFFCPRVSLPCIVTLMRVAPRPLDDDNNVSALKACRDGIADRLGVKDNDPSVTWRYKQCKGEPRVYEVFVTIEPRP